MFKNFRLLIEQFYRQHYQVIKIKCTVAVEDALIIAVHFTVEGIRIGRRFTDCLVWFDELVLLVRYVADDVSRVVLFDVQIAPFQDIFNYRFLIRRIQDREAVFISDIVDVAP